MTPPPIGKDRTEASPSATYRPMRPRLQLDAADLYAVRFAE